MASEAAAYFGIGGNAIYKGSSGLLTTVADDLGAFSGVGPYQAPDINDWGLVEFFAGYDAGGEGFFIGDGASITKVTDTNDGLSSFFFYFGLQDSAPAEASLSNEGVVYFKAAGVFTDRDGTLVQVQSPGAGSSGLSINNRGDVAFVDRYISGEEHVLRVARASGSVETLASTAGLFQAIGEAAINDSGGVTFNVCLDAGGRGIWTTRDLTNAVIKAGDPLFGSTVTAFGGAGGRFDRRGFNNRGQVAFSYVLADGRRGIAVATRTSACNNAVDDDGDGFIDYPADPGCAWAGAWKEDPPCSDGIDNDGDGLIDLADPECSSPSDQLEGVFFTGCGIGPELAVLLPALLRLRRRGARWS